MMETLLTSDYTVTPGGIKAGVTVLVSQDCDKAREIFWFGAIS